MKRLVFISVFAICGCQTVPAINTCPAPPSATMLPPQALEPLPERELTAQAVLDLWAEDIGMHKATAARLAALQAWWRDHCAKP